METRKILIIPTNFPIELDGAVEALKKLREESNLDSIALQIEKQKQKYLDQIVREQRRADNKQLGYFYPIVNYALENSKKVHAVGEREFEEILEAIRTYQELSHLCEQGVLAYVCSQRNAQMIRRIRIID